MVSYLTEKYQSFSAGAAARYFETLVVKVFQGYNGAIKRLKEVAMAIQFIDEIDIAQKKLLLREDLNVPLEEGEVTSDARIRAALPTIQYALEQNAAVLVISHLGRPEEGSHDPALSLEPVAERLSQLLDHPVKFEAQWIDGVELKSGEVVLGENVRFLKGEKKNDPELAKRMAQLVDVFVMDAFATAHRDSASTTGVATYVKQACGGLLLKSELKALEPVWERPQRPVVAIVGGAKVSSKFGVLKALLDKVDVLIPGGGIANTFLAASGYGIADSLYEADMLEGARELLAQASSANVEIALPEDVIIGDRLSDDASSKLELVTAVDHGMILDIGPESIRRYRELIKRAGTIIWNGPVGVFEIPQFAKGTEAIAQAIADSRAYSLAGGGDTVAAIEKFDVVDKISYISTGGGAFLTLLEGKTLPAVAALESK